MKSLCVFLRGVNVKGTKMKMEDLRKAFTKMGYKDIKTLLASGNVVISTADESSLEEHTNKIEAGISKYFDYDAHVIVKSPEDIKSLCDEGMTHTVPDDHQHYLVLTSDPILGKELEGLYDGCVKSETESFILGDYGIYWIVPKGNTLGSEFGDKVLGKRYRERLTTRTMNTVRKVYKEVQARLDGEVE